MDPFQLIEPVAGDLDLEDEPPACSTLVPPG